MKLEFKQIVTSELNELIDWLTSDTWPFFVNENLETETVKTWVEEGIFTGIANQTFWIILENNRIGLIRLHDLTDPTPMFDLRIRTDYRGSGIGKAALDWVTEYIFTNMPDKLRIEGNTRQDNVAMRKVFKKCGYVKEAHYRKAWPGKINYNGIGYAILKEDWLQNKITPVDWNDEHF